jgi:hypothetical protein
MIHEENSYRYSSMFIDFISSFSFASMISLILKCLIKTIVKYFSSYLNECYSSGFYHEVIYVKEKYSKYFFIYYWNKYKYKWSKTRLKRLSVGMFLKYDSIKFYLSK